MTFKQFITDWRVLSSLVLAGLASVPATAGEARQFLIPAAAALFFWAVPHRVGP